MSTRVSEPTPCSSNPTGVCRHDHPLHAATSRTRRATARPATARSRRQRPPGPLRSPEPHPRKVEEAAEDRRAADAPDRDHRNHRRVPPPGHDGPRPVSDGCRPPARRGGWPPPGPMAERPLMRDHPEKEAQRRRDDRGCAARSASAAGDRSIAHTRHRGRSAARVMAIQPDPVPTSSTLASLGNGRSRAVSTTNSVSGRGTSTAGLTSKSRPQNGQVPVRWWAGSPAARRSSQTLVPAFDLRRDLALGMEPQGDLVDPPRGGQQPRRLPPWIGNPLPRREQCGTRSKSLLDGHRSDSIRIDFEFRISDFADSCSRPYSR